MCRLLWGNVMMPLLKGIIFGMGSKLGAVLIRYLFMKRYVDYGKFVSPAERQAQNLAASTSSAGNAK